MINELKHNEIFVFGSNLQGRHYDGAAKQAYEQFGAEWGVGVGLTGKCYAIPTMEGFESMERYIKQFIKVAALMPQYTFLVTKVGCGIAGHDENKVRELFRYVSSNVVLPQDWRDYDKKSMSETSESNI